MPLRPAGFEPGVSGLDFLSDGRLVICTWGGQRDKLATVSAKGELFIVSGVTGDDPAKVTFKKVATGLEEPLGLKVVDDQIYLGERTKLVRMVDKDGDSLFETKEKVADAPGGASRSEWFYGLIYKSGYFYANFALGFDDGGTISVPQPHPNRGTVARISKADGKIEYLAGGFRTHNGIAFGPDDEIFVTDNQGQWMPSCKFVNVRKGRYYGVKPAGDFESKTVTPPTAWLPYGESSISASSPIYIAAGPYAGQFFFGDVNYGGLQRIFVEKVNGEWQGAVFLHSQGLEAGSNRMVWGPDGALYVGGIGTGTDWMQPGKKAFGLEKLKPTGIQPFEMVSVRSRSGGMEIEFSKDVGASASVPANYEARTWTFAPSIEYGAGNKQQNTALTVARVEVHTDKRRVFLEIPGLKPGWLAYIHLKNVSSAAGEKPWATEAWYTLNNISPSAPFSPTTRIGKAGLAPGGARSIPVARAGRDLLKVGLPDLSGTYVITVHDARGGLRGQAEGRGGSEVLVRLLSNTGGTLLIRLRGGSGELRRLVALP